MLGATGVQIEAPIRVCQRYFRNFGGLTPDVMTCWGQRPFFYLFSAGKTVRIFDFGRKIPLNFWSSPCSIDLDWNKFFVPPCPSRIQMNKLLVPPQILVLPPPQILVLPPPPP